MNKKMQERENDKMVMVKLNRKAMERCWYENGDCGSNMQKGYVREYEIFYPDGSSEVLTCVKALNFQTYWGRPQEWTSDTEEFDGVKLDVVRKGKWISISEILSFGHGCGRYYNELEYKKQRDMEIKEYY